MMVQDNDMDKRSKELRGAFDIARACYEIGQFTERLVPKYCRVMTSCTKGKTMVLYTE
jgi:hypothetical protein